MKFIGPFGYCRSNFKNLFFHLVLVLFFFVAADAIAQTCCTFSPAWTEPTSYSQYAIGIAVGPSGYIYAPNSTNNRVDVFTNTGANAPAAYGPIPTLNTPDAIAIDSVNNYVYVTYYTTSTANFNVSKYSLTSPFGSAGGNWPITLPTSPSGPYGYAMCVDSVGDLFVTTTQMSQDSVFEYSSAGILMATANHDTAGVSIQGATGVCMNSAGTTLFVCESAARGILAYPVISHVLQNPTNPPSVGTMSDGPYQLINEVGNSNNYLMATSSYWAEYTLDNASGGLTPVATCMVQGTPGQGCVGIAQDSSGSIYLGTYNPNTVERLGCTFTVTPTATLTASDTATLTPTLSLPNTNTPTHTDTATNTDTNTATNTVTHTATHTATNTSTNTPVFTNTFTLTTTETTTSTFTQTPSSTKTDTSTITLTPTITNTPTNTPIGGVPTNTPTSVAGGCVGSPITGYTYPNPATGPSMNVQCDLCEQSQVTLMVYNVAAEKIATYARSGPSGSNVFSVDISSFSHGIYYLMMLSTGPSGSRKSEMKKFAVVR